MLMKYGMLTQDERIGSAMQNAGALAMFASLATSTWVLRVMALSPGTAPRSAEDERFEEFLGGDSGD